MLKVEMNKYAEVILKTGINLQKGQCVQIYAGPDHLNFALSLEEKAYQLGAKYVRNIIHTQHSVLNRVSNTVDEEYLDFIPDFETARGYEQVSTDWAVIHIDQTEEMDVLADADPVKIQRIMKTRSKKLQMISDATIQDKIAWTIAAFPGKKWAEDVLGKNSSPEELWDILKTVLRLENDDPAEAWRQHSEKLDKRRKMLEQLKLKKILFNGPGTELEIGLPSGSVWMGGNAEMPNGRKFLPNIPTEEVFTTPDRSKTNGKVRTTRPALVMGRMVENAEFEFKDGKLVSLKAEKGQEALEQFAAVDEGAGYLGEAALVDSSSKIFESGKIFKSILFDENAACHIALGNGFPPAYPGGHRLNSKEEKIKAGCNDSLIHGDFMIGSEEVDVTGVREDGGEVLIMSEGTFVI